MTTTKTSNRREFLLDTSRGLGGGLSSVALAAMLADDGITRAANGPAVPDGLAHIAPQAKSVIWMFMVGGASHMETFDPKPALNKYSGISIDKTPFAEALKNPFVDENVRIVVPDDANGHIWPKVYPLQVGFRKRGESGIEISDWWPHLGDCIDDLAIVRSMWTTDNNHGAQLQFHTGRHSLDGFFPTVGSWIHYGLGSLNEDLPQFVVMGTPIADCCGGQGAHGANYLGPEHDGVQLDVNPDRPLPFATPGGALYREEQKGQFQLLEQLNQVTASLHPDDVNLRARSSPTDWPTECRWPCPKSCSSTARRNPRNPATASTTTPLAPSASNAWQPGEWSNAECDSFRSSTGPTAVPVGGTDTAICRPVTANCARKPTSRSPH